MGEVSTMDPVTRSAAKKASNLLGSEDEKEAAAARAIIQQWRKQHLEPTWGVFDSARMVCRSLSGALATFRLKRMESIESKILRPGKNYDAGAMDDIGGCRIILPGMNELNAARELITDAISVRKVKDYVYVDAPPSGYRSIHVLTQNEGKEKGLSYRVEVQLRTELQHAWATAIEAASNVYGENYKDPAPRAISENGVKRLEFFRLVSAGFALSEGVLLDHGVPQSIEEIREKLRESSVSKDIVDDLELVTDDVVQLTEGHQGPGLYLLVFEREKQEVAVQHFDEDDPRKAFEAYNDLEEKNSSARDTAANLPDGVLVYSDNPERLPLAYPNYSSNVNVFLKRYREIFQLEDE
ncbi:RelA/SpoT domain-containing protein [Actinotignum sp. GS-2025e]|uniref:RelA/SpoT domain-containing protein n=1 Tax=Actinotignum sp. GS-2025e TaxID=3427278 RepID=UPI003F479DA6